MARGGQTTWLCALAVSGTMAGGASAAQWSAEPSFTFGGDLDSNRRLVAGGERSSSAHVSASLDVARETETQKLQFLPRFDARRYDGVDEALDSNDIGADLLYQLSTERASWSWQATAREDGTLTSELGDTGIVEGRAERRTLTGAGQVAWKVTERTELQVGANWLDVSFDDAVGTGLIPYRYPGAFVGFARETGDRSRFTFMVNGARLDVPDTGARVDNLAAEARWRTRLNERLSLEFSGGLNRVENDFSADQGAVYSVSGEWSNPRSALSLTLARDVEPSALGRMMKVDSVTGQWNWQLGERAWFTLSLRHLRRADLLFGLLPERRDYTTANAAVKWRLDEHWNLELRGGAARQAFKLLDYEADGERLELFASWTPRGLR